MDQRTSRSQRNFELAAPYEVLLPATYEEGKRYPLVVALHGMGQDESVIRRDLAPLFDRPWIWLFPRGPYPLEIRGRHVMRIGYAWYMFDGDQTRLRQSMDASCRHLLAIIDTLWNTCRIDLSKAAVLGFSQGGYLAGVLGATNPMRFKAACSIGGRIKHEFLTDAAAKAGPRVALAQIHGGRDESVKPQPARDSIEAASKLGFTRAEYFEDPEAGHEITPRMVDWLGTWLERVL